MRYTVTKTYGHERGLSCAFRQWRAESHCRFLHGYALAFTLTFGVEELDERGWVIDFGGLGPVEAYLRGQFDHKLLVAADDPHAALLASLPAAEVLVCGDGVGCERFADMVFEWVDNWLLSQPYGGRVYLLSVECREHGANAATMHSEIWK